MISPPVFVEPVNATLSTPGCLTRYAPVVGPSPGTMLIAPGGKPDHGCELRDAQHAQRRLRVRLEDDRAAGRERGRELPGRHQQRVVPRHDLGGDADGLLQRVEEQRAADRSRAAGDRRDRGRVEAEVLGGTCDLGLDGRDRLADVARLELRELLAVRARSRRRARAGAATARCPASSPRGRRARPARRRPRGRRPPRRPWRRGRAAPRSRARRASRSSPDAGSTTSPSMKSPRSVATAIPGNLPGGCEELADPHVLGQELREASGVAVDVGAADVATG